MTASGVHALPALGFLTVVEHDQHGLFGGYLVLNGRGRPLEFHCTAPVKPNRAQEILYGATLIPYLYGEQIGATLAQKASIQPGLICVDRPVLLTVRDQTALPVALVQRPASSTSGVDNDRTIRLDGPQASSHAGPHFSFGGHHLSVASRYTDDQAAALALLSGMEELFDLNEPFDRIREAIDEAQRGSR